MDRLVLQQVKFLHQKACHLKNEYETRKTAGEKKIQKMEAELRFDLERLEKQINEYRIKIAELQK